MVSTQPLDASLGEPDLEAAGDRALEAGFRSRGVNEFLSKPVALCTLRQRIEKLLECHDRQIVESV